MRAAFAVRPKHVAEPETETTRDRETARKRDRERKRGKPKTVDVYNSHTAQTQNTNCPANKKTTPTDTKSDTAEYVSEYIESE